MRAGFYNKAGLDSIKIKTGGLGVYPPPPGIEIKKKRERKI